jgi:tRNA-2-methylthio-N6-dimethylallyladenosine synthase
MVFYIKTYGCQMNVYDSERISELLEAAGMRPLPPNDTKNNADVIILNTCNIRDKAEHKVYTELGFLKKIKNERAAAGKQTIIAVGGCVAQAEGDNILRRAPFVNLVFGTQRFCEIADALSELFAELQNQATGNEPQKQLLNLQSIAPIELKTRASTSGPHSQANPHKTAAFVAIQEGCDKFCTYCVVPHTRGQEVSRDAESVLAEVLALSSAGVKEITLLGQNVNAYHGAAPAADGSAMATWDLARLLHAVGQISGVERIFYGTSHPRDVNEALAQAHASIHTLMPFIHLPVQSGSDRVLKRMNRKYTVQQYLDIVELFRKHTPNIAFSSDFIVGFPGESEDDFEQTLELVRKVEYAQAFSFKYSPRPRTPASTMPDQIPEKVKKERLARLQDLLQQQQINFNNSCVGKTLSVMFQRLGKSERQVLGKSEYMQSVVVSGVQPDAFMHKICIVKIERASLSCLEGSIVSPEKSSN